MAYIGKHEGYPTYVAIKVSRNLDCDLLFSVWKGGGGGIDIGFAKRKWNGMIREPSLMSQEIKPMDLMEVIKVCCFLLSPLFFLFSPHGLIIIR